MKSVIVKLQDDIIGGISLGPGYVNVYEDGNLFWIEPEGLPCRIECKIQHYVSPSYDECLQKVLVHRVQNNILSLRFDQVKEKFSEAWLAFPSSWRGDLEKNGNFCEFSGILFQYSFDSDKIVQILFWNNNIKSWTMLLSWNDKSHCWEYDKAVSDLNLPILKNK